MKRAPSGHVLIAHSQIGGRTLLKINFERRGYSQDIVSSGPEALEIASQRRPDFAVLGPSFGDESGFDVATALRDLYPDLPIMIFDFRMTEQDKITAAQMGIVPHSWGIGHEFTTSLYRLTGNPRYGRTRILLVHDDGAMAGMLDQHLRKLSYTVTHASNRDSAVEHALAESYHMVIFELHSSTIQGHDLANALRIADPKLILFLLGMPDERFEQSMSGHKFDFVSLPIDSEELDLRMRNALIPRYI